MSSRILKILAAATFVALASEVGCSCGRNDNPGIESVDAAMSDGGMEDGGMDAGVGMPGRFVMPSGPVLLAVTTDPSRQALVALSHLSDAGAAVSFSEMPVRGTMNPGIGIGDPVSLLVDSRRRFLQLVLNGPPRVVFFEIGLLVTDVTADEYVGSMTDQLGRASLRADGAYLYFTNINANTVERYSVADKTGTKVTGAQVIELSKPAFTTLLNDGKILVGSADPWNRWLLVFEDTGALTYRASLNVELVDGANAGFLPSPCAAVAGEAHVYCASASQADGGGGGLLWKVLPGNAAKVVATDFSSPGLIISSPKGERIYLVDGSSVRSYWVKSPYADAPVPLSSLNLGAPIFDLVNSDDGAFLYASVPSANLLVKITTVDLSIVERYESFDRPKAIAFSP